MIFDRKCAARFSRRPLLKLSTTRTSAPRSTRASTRAEPINEAPPVTSTRLLFQFIIISLVSDLLGFRQNCDVLRHRYSGSLLSAESVGAGFRSNAERNVAPEGASRRVPART